MPLRSILMRGDTALEACLVRDASHLVPGAKGSHVAKIQTAVCALNGFTIHVSELQAQHYGPSTAAAVLAYKRSRKIINRAYQTQPDNIVGKMTISSLDGEIFAYENRPALPSDEHSRVPEKREIGAGSRAAK